MLCLEAAVGNWSRARKERSGTLVLTRKAWFWKEFKLRATKAPSIYWNIYGGVLKIWVLDETLMAG